MMVSSGFFFFPLVVVLQNDDATHVGVVLVGGAAGGFLFVPHVALDAPDVDLVRCLRGQGRRGEAGVVAPFPVAERDFGMAADGAAPEEAVVAGLERLLLAVLLDVPRVAGPVREIPKVGIRHQDTAPAVALPLRDAHSQNRFPPRLKISLVRRPRGHATRLLPVVLVVAALAPVRRAARAAFVLIRGVLRRHSIEGCPHVLRVLNVLHPPQKAPRHKKLIVTDQHGVVRHRHGEPHQILDVGYRLDCLLVGHQRLHGPTQLLQHASLALGHDLRPVHRQGPGP